LSGKHLTHEHDRWDLGIADPVASALRSAVELAAGTYMYRNTMVVLLLAAN